MDPNNLSLQVGDKLQLQKIPEDRPERYLVQVVGYMPRQSLIVNAPRIHGKVAIMRPDQRFRVRVLQGSSIVGFVSFVLKSYSAPFPHLHLSYPTEMERIVVRNALRTAVDQPALVRHPRHPDSQEYYRSVRLIDLSHSGARFVSKVPLGHENDMLLTRFGVAVCGQEEKLEVLCQIRSMGKRAVEGEPLEFWLGVQFQALTRFQQVLLQAFVLEQFVGEKTLSQEG